MDDWVSTDLPTGKTLLQLRHYFIFFEISCAIVIDAKYIQTGEKHKIAGDKLSRRFRG